MNTEREIADIKARLDRIEAFLTGASGGTGSNDSEPAYELLDLQVKKSQSMIGPEYA
ncbi:MAG: hypothetical protein H7Y36_04390 [Armatimonadetes bacterium]|nr:hypothetical protein [Akkermansiaceae bacterium]